jgi:hypothetical protein
MRLSVEAMGSNPTLSAIYRNTNKNNSCYCVLLLLEHLERSPAMISIYQRLKNDAGKWRYSKVAEGVGGAQFV